MKFTNRIMGLQLALNWAGQLNERQKVKVPAFMAEWIELCKEKADLCSCLNGYYEIGDGTIVRPRGFSEDFYDWLSDFDHMHDLARAYLEGYEVEEEPKYRVALPLTVWDDDAAMLNETTMFLAFDITSDETRFFHSPKKFDDYRTELTESEIRSVDERYWTFAVPVEKV